MTSLGATELLRLNELITKSITQVIKHYAAAGQDVPALDSVKPGPFDTPESCPVDLLYSTQIIEAACHQLCAAVSSPGSTMVNRSYGYYEPACLRIVTQHKIPDLLFDAPGGCLHLDDLAAKLELDSNKLGRILRVLATRHCFREVEPDVFTNNRLSIKLLSADPVSSLIGHMSDEAMKGAAYMYEALSNSTTENSMSPDASAFTSAHGIPIFEYYKLHPEKNVRFAKAMTGWGDVTGREMLPRAYPWNNLPPGSTICDFGGSTGHATLPVIKAFPTLKSVVQDLPSVVAEGPEYWDKGLPGAQSEGRVRFVGFDFFKDLPASNCDVYYLRHVLHDWPTSEAKKILANVRKAVKPSSKLLIHEFVLQPLIRKDDHSSEPQLVQLAQDIVGITEFPSQAPEPLLPNYGMGKIRLYQQDLNMMNLLNSKERMLSEWIEIGESTGFKFVKLWDTGEAGLVEFEVFSDWKDGNTVTG